MVDTQNSYLKNDYLLFANKFAYTWNILLPSGLFALITYATERNKHENNIDTCSNKVVN